MDGQIETSFRAPPTGGAIYTYDVLLYAANSLEHGSHTVKIQNGEVGGNLSLLLFDYITYFTCVDLLAKLYVMR